MPKVRFYVDLWPGMSTEHMMAFTHPGPKTLGVLHVAFDVELPDPLEPNVVLPGVYAAQKMGMDGIKAAIENSFAPDVNTSQRRIIPG